MAKKSAKPQEDKGASAGMTGEGETGEGGADGEEMGAEIEAWEGAQIDGGEDGDGHRGGEGGRAAEIANRADLLDGLDDRMQRPRARNQVGSRGQKVSLS